MSSVFARDLKADYPKAVSAGGMYIHDSDGKCYLDMSGGAAVSCLGHQHPAVLKAVKLQFQNMAFAHTAFFTNEPQEKLAALIAGQFTEEGAKVYFSSGGSEANETALKMAWQYWQAKGQPGKTKIVSREHSYHGNTFGAFSASGNPRRRARMAGVLVDWPRIDACYPYRKAVEGESEEAYGLRMANKLEEAIAQEGADTIAAFIAEPVVGASLGVVAAPKGYFKRIREICDAHDILLILDEIMCGTGRTGTFFAHEQEGIVPDLVTLAKGIGGGYQPLAATVARKKLVTFFKHEGGFDHGHTYIGHATACAAGLAVTRTLKEEDLLKRVQAQGAKYLAALTKRFSQHPHVGDIRGRGLFLGLEFVADRESKTPVKDAGAVAGQLKKAAMKNGLICYPGAAESAHILLAPPFILEDQHIGEALDKLERIIQEVFGD